MFPLYPYYYLSFSYSDYLFFLSIINNQLSSLPIVTAFLSIVKDSPPPTEFFDIIYSNIGLIAGLVTSVSLIITTIIKVVTELKKSVTAENRAIRKENSDAIKKLEAGALSGIQENKHYIENVRDNLSEQMTYETNKLSDKIDTHKDNIGEVKTIIEKMDDKLDRNQDLLTKNTVRIDAHENRIGMVEGLVYDRIITREYTNKVTTRDMRKRRGPENQQQQQSEDNNTQTKNTS